MRKRHLVIILLVFMCGPALAADPVGEWLVADGTAKIRIAQCANALWGVISWTQEPGVDSNNPDPEKRNRSIIGLPILRSMKAAGPNRWEGEVYNAQNGKMYSANIALLSDDVLKIQGCVLGGLFCGGENWTRAQSVRAAPASKQACHDS
jgi:uncharacterized protein (DUF2147 family)